MSATLRRLLARISSNMAGSELNLGHLAGGLVGLEVLALVELQHPSEEHGGERLQLVVVAGKMNAKDIDAAIKKGNGKATLKTVSGGTLTAWMKGKDLYITDENGNSAKVTIADVNQKNGVIHVVDTVVTPKS